MALDADILAEIRSHVGSTPDDTDLEARYTRHGTVAATALEVIRGRLADILARPEQLRVEGDYSESWAANIKALQAKEQELVGLVVADGGAGGVQVARLTRVGRSR